MNQLATMLETLGLPVAMPEPEVAAAELAIIRARSLASIIAGLLNENEPMLKAQADGGTITVSYRGGGAVMRCTVEGDTAKRNQLNTPREPGAGNSSRSDK